MQSPEEEEKKNLVKALEFKKIYIIYENSIDHFRSQYSVLLYKMRILGYKINEFICEVSKHDDSDIHTSKKPINSIGSRSPLVCNKSDRE